LGRAGRLSALDPGKQGLKQKRKLRGPGVDELSALDPGKQGLKQTGDVDVVNGLETFSA